MYLKSIDMYGFKSFANKIAFSFDEGITAIVGPNGSGKSNISDAVRWVLGEMSAKSLRGSNMRDVIFAGTESRRPLGYCQVDLTIDNTDQKMAISFSEVTVSRRVYRSGESEYYINGTACRLKDIHELFMDTGVGKEGYSIIGQGQIDKIISSKPDDRRGLFDEAAGIVKYKKRKVNAEKQLAEEEQNLIRINDIIRELEGQENSLREQSEKAKVFLQHKETLKRNEVNIYVNEMESLDKKIHNFTEKEGIVYDQISGARKEKDDLAQKQSETASGLEEIDREIASNQHLATQIAVEKEKRESAISLAKEQINNIKVNINRLNIENKTLEGKVHVKQTELDGYDKNVKEAKASAKEHIQALETQENLLDACNNGIQAKELQIERIQADMIERLNDISGTKSKILRYQTMIESNESRLKTLKQQKEDMETLLKEFIQLAEEGKEDLQAIEKKQKEIKQSRADLETSHRDIVGKRLDLNKSLNTLKSEANRLDSKHKALSEIADGYEGYQYSIKSLMGLKTKNDPKASGIIGVVSEVLEVAEKFEKATEVALGNKIQNVIVGTEQDAKVLINYLKENRFGRATFLPMNAISAMDAKPKIDPSEEGFYGYGHEVVKVDSKYNELLKFLIGRIGFVKDMETGIKISRKYKRKVHLVTLAGEEIRPGGSMTGGAFKNKGNQFLSRKRDIEAIEVSLKEARAEIDIEEKELMKIEDEFKLIDKKKQYYVEENQSLSIEFNKVAIELKQYENEINKQKEEQEAVLLELNQLEEQEENFSKNIESLESTLDGTEGQNTEQEQQVKELLTSIVEDKKEKDLLTEQLTSLKVAATTSESELNFIKSNKERVSNELEELNNQIIENNNMIMGNEEEMTEKTLMITESIEASGESDTSIKEKEAAIVELNNNKHKLTEAREQLYKKREDMNEQISQLEKELIRLQNQKEKVENQKHDQATYMWHEYEITINNASQYADDDLGTLTEMRNNIRNLRKAIKDLGPVNVNSIEEYKSVHERYEFLSVQRDDLVLSKEKITQVIMQLKNEMETQFRQKFKEISTKFTEVFQELFGGGKALLQLVDDDNILEAGIEIIASPPGKKLQSMNLLSGGEKAFTAISLLFAIQSLKPSPFCVLDEIEAALDDANVVRFASYLQKLVKNTQFIIITHRKGTMEAADALYGITMQEKGVSTQVSVKMLEDQLEN